MVHLGITVAQGRAVRCDKKFFNKEDQIMKLSLPVILTLGLLAASALPSAAAQTIEDADIKTVTEDVDDDPIQRVARVTFVDGDVSFLRAGVDEWADVVQNLPLLEGDQLYVGQGGRAELQLGNGNYIRLSEKTALTIADLTDKVAQFEITEGVATIRLERFGAAFSRFEIDTPNSALVFEKDGLYRVNVRGADSSEVIIRKGSAEVATLDGSFKLREGHRLLVDTSPDGRLEVVADSSRDEWDRWTYDRDQTIDRASASASPDYVSIQETTYNSFYGASELGNYGSWSSVGDYGYCWVPRVSSGWAPYRSGQWLWVPRAGWTWLADEPWGWAPYHYGRWAFLPGLGWAWVPGIHSNNYRYNRSYYQWRPALVYFFNSQTPRGHYVAWYPLTPGERWRRHDHYGNNGENHSHLQNPSPRNAGRRPDFDGRGNNRNNGVSVLPVAGFTRPGRTRVNPGAPDEDVSRWTNRGSGRPGLPDLGSTQSAAAPGSRRNGEPGRSRPVVTPPHEISIRPIVTRNRPTSSETEHRVPRERRLIAPHIPFTVGEGRTYSSGDGGQGEKGRGNNSWRAGRPDRAAGETLVPSGQRVRTPDVSTPAGDDDAKAKRRERRENKANQQDGNEQDGSSDSEKARSRIRLNPVPRPPDDTASQNKQNEEREKARAERRRSGNEDQSHSDNNRNRDRSNNSGSENRERQRQPERAQPPPPQNPPETRQEHRQEKQERREERREERRKGQ